MSCANITYTVNPWVLHRTRNVNALTFNMKALSKSDRAVMFRSSAVLSIMI